MDDSLSAATRRLRADVTARRNDSYRNSPYWDAAKHGWSDSGQSLHDRQAVIDAYLAEHADDDSAPVSESWLNSVGFVRTSDPKQPARDAFYLDGGTVLYAPHRYGDFKPGWFAMKDFSVPHPETRGDVRRLCKSLGVAIH
jgi:hypothetical protein